MAPLGDRLLVKPQEEAKVPSGQHSFGGWHFNVGHFNVVHAQFVYQKEASALYTLMISCVHIYLLQHGLL